MTDKTYIGRFAPSPTGPMHFGTLVAALGSYLQAKAKQGKWLVRMEDVDITRSVADADSSILRSLEAFGFEWDDEVIYQSHRTEIYAETLEILSQAGATFHCTCSRKQLSATPGKIYPGICREHLKAPKGEHAVRLRIEDIDIQFEDAVMGSHTENLATDCGDFVIRRRDGLYAYQLAVVVDDAQQGVTEIVRGADLLDSTARQIFLQQRLGYPTSAYVHLPLVLTEQGEKFSKSSQALAIEDKHPVPALWAALDFLGQKPPTDLHRADLEDLWEWALENWNLQAIPSENKRV